MADCRWSSVGIIKMGSMLVQRSVGLLVAYYFQVSPNEIKGVRMKLKNEIKGVRHLFGSYYWGHQPVFSKFSHCFFALFIFPYLTVLCVLCALGG